MRRWFLFVMAAMFMATLPCTAQFVRTDIDTMTRSQAFAVDRVYSGNTPYLRFYVFEDGVPFTATNHDWYFKYGTNRASGTMVTIANATTASNRVDFVGTTNTFGQANDDWFCEVIAISKTNTGLVTTWSQGRLIEFASPGAGVTTNLIFTATLNWNTIGTYSGTWPLYSADTTVLTIAASGTGVVFNVISGSGTLTGFKATNGLSGGGASGMITGSVDYAWMVSFMASNTALGSVGNITNIVSSNDIITVTGGAGPQAVINVSTSALASALSGSFSTGTPLYAESYTGSVGSLSGMATGTPVYVEEDTNALGKLVLASNTLAGRISTVESYTSRTVAVEGYTNRAASALASSVWALAESTTGYMPRVQQLTTNALLEARIATAETGKTALVLFNSTTNVLQQQVTSNQAAFVAGSNSLDVRATILESNTVLRSGGEQVMSASLESYGSMHARTNLVAANTNSVGSELLANGTFSGNASGWDLGGSASYNANNVIVLPGAAATINYTNSVAVVAGKTYNLSWLNTSTPGTDFTTFKVALGGETNNISVAPTGTVTYLFTRVMTTENPRWIVTPGANQWILDTVSLKEVTEGDGSFADDVTVGGKLIVSESIATTGLVSAGVALIGSENTVSASTDCSVFGAVQSVITGAVNSVVVGGIDNYIIGSGMEDCIIAGGAENVIQEPVTVNVYGNGIFAGIDGKIYGGGDQAVILGGSYNVISNQSLDAVILGGTLNRVRGLAHRAVVAGVRAVATNAYCVVWNSDATADYGSHGDGTYNLNPTGGVYVGNNYLVDGHGKLTVNAATNPAAADGSVLTKHGTNFGLETLTATATNATLIVLDNTNYIANQTFSDTAEIDVFNASNFQWQIVAGSIASNKLSTNVWNQIAQMGAGTGILFSVTSDAPWLVVSNGYGGQAILHPTNTPLFAETYTGSVGSLSGMATGTPLYVESDPVLGASVASNEIDWATMPSGLVDGDDVGVATNYGDVYLANTQKFIGFNEFERQASGEWVATFSNAVNASNPKGVIISAGNSGGTAILSLEKFTNGPHFAFFTDESSGANWYSNRLVNVGDILPNNSNVQSAGSATLPFAEVHVGRVRFADGTTQTTASASSDTGATGATIQAGGSVTGMPYNATTRQFDVQSTAGGGSGGLTNIVPGTGLSGSLVEQQYFVTNTASSGGAGAYAFQGTNNIAPTNGQNTINASAVLSTISGGSGNVISNGAVNSFIGGGINNTVGEHLYNTVCGGTANNAGDFYAFIGGGLGNTIVDLAGSGQACTIAGGYNNGIGVGGSITYWSAILGGRDNLVNAGYASICGGYGNIIANLAGKSFIGGGEGCSIGDSANNSTVSGGFDNDIGASSTYGFIGGGNNNDIAASSIGSTIGGGALNNLNSAVGYATIAGGYDCNISAGSGGYDFIGGGLGNEITASQGMNVICGGGYSSASFGNKISARRCNSIVGGLVNTIRGGGDGSFIGGGGENDIYNSYYSVSLGNQGVISNTVDQAQGYSTIVGNGANLITNSHYAMILGNFNQASGTNTLVIGTKGKVQHDGSIVISAGTSTNALFASTGNDQVLIRASGGVWVNDAGTLNLVSGTRFVTNVNPHDFIPSRQGVTMYDVGSNLTYLAEAATTNDWVLSAVWTAAP